MGDELVVDARYKSCPGPLVSLIRVMRRAEPGQRIKLLSTDPRSPNDVREWASRTGHKFLEYKQIDDYFEIYVEA
jgi:TusA-related sulfurtransferase